MEKELKPYKGFYYFEFFHWHKRKLHYKQVLKNGLRKRFGTTLTEGIQRGTLLRHKKHGLAYLGGFGTSKKGITIYNLDGTKRLSRVGKIQDCVFLGILKWKINIIKGDKKC